MLLERRSRAALLRGGYIWRVAVSHVDFKSVLNGPTGLYSGQGEMFTVVLPDGKQYVDDALTETEMSLLIGGYKCETGHGNQLVLKSWCPLPSTYEKSGVDYGRWTNFNETLYNIAYTDTEVPNPILQRQPCSAKQWRNICRGSRDLRRGLARLESASLLLIRQHCKP
ncbi:hypothetical protein HYPSUDRAFT_152286 [Hypholoma sublateritium FD-334 SS-4]|uniref:Uncharacterized protein n=1 Tax=Hypholoma sublateritium (strain FD-334 SS-4) TaxID=945553 RepID=A0A0D2LPM3_HYPSF|nr:hypothetical protein HYPSUDRAFT_152286 [Hypholoma sublateritium FD-334 SS-4]